MHRACEKAMAIALAATLATAGVPASALGTARDALASGPIPVRSCLLVQALGPSDVAAEPVLAELDGTYLLGYPSQGEAESAKARLSAAGLQAESDRILVDGSASVPPTWDAYAAGLDPFSAARKAIESWESVGSEGDSTPRHATASICDSDAGRDTQEGDIVLLHPEGPNPRNAGVDDAAHENGTAGVNGGIRLQALHQGAATTASLYAALRTAIADGVASIELPHLARHAESDMLRKTIEDARATGVAISFANAGECGGEDNGESPEEADGGKAMPDAGTEPEGAPRDAESHGGMSPEETQSTLEGAPGDSPHADRADAAKEDAGAVPADGGVNAQSSGSPSAKPTASAQARAAKAASSPAKAAASSMSVTVKKTELRSDLKWGGHHADRTSSAVPANEVVIDGGWKLPLKDAKLQASGFKKGKPVKAQRKFNVNNGTDTECYGVWLPFDASYVKDKEVKVPGTFTLTWADVGSDADGNRLDLVVTVTDIRLKTNDSGARKSKSICLMRNSGSTSYRGALMASARMQSVSGIGSLRCGASMEITAHLYVSGTKNDTAARYVMSFTDLDQPDGTRVARTYAKGAGYVEGVQLVSGFDGRAYLQQDVAQKERNGSDSWTNPGKASDGSATWGASCVRVDKGTAHFCATAAAGADGVDKHAGYYRSGFTTRTSGKRAFSFRWHGTRCDTYLFMPYEGVKVRDRNDPAKKGTSDQAIIKKTVNDDGQRYATSKAADASKRTKTTFRTTDMPWKGAATYTFSAKPGYRVSKVTVVGYEGNAVKVPKKTYTKGAQLKSLSFAGTAPSGGFATVMDYDIVVTTAKVANAKATITAKKTLSGATLAANQFTFGMYASKGATKAIATAKNDASGNIRFSGIDALSYAYDDTQKYPMTKTYYLHEAAGNAAGFTYDDTWWQATVTVDYNASFTPSTSVAYRNLSKNTAATQPAFANSMAQYAGVKVRKVDANGGAGLPGAKFSVYRGSFDTAAAAMASGNPIATMTSGSDGLASLSATRLALGSYTVVETAAPSGYYLGGQSGSTIAAQWCRKFTLSVPGQVLDLTGDPCRNDRKDTTTAWWPPQVKKAVDGRELVGGEYTFRLMNPQTGEVLQTAVNDENGDVTFKEIAFPTSMKNRVYHYVIEEVDGGDAQTTYDKSWWQADVVRYVNKAYSNPRHRVNAIYTRHGAGDAKPSRFYDPCYSETPVPTAASSSNTLTLVYHANGATGIIGGSSGITALRDPLDTKDGYKYAGMNFRDDGINNYSDNPGGGSAYILERTGWIPTQFWRVGSENSNVRIHQDEAFPDGVKAMAAAMGLDLSRRSATVHLYAEWVPDDGTHAVWQTNMYGGLLEQSGGPRARFSNSYEARSGVSVVKADAATGEPLAGASFEIRGDGDGARLFEEGGAEAESLTIVTGEDGMASTHAKALVAGKAYRIREVSAPEGYAIDDGSWHDFVAGGEDGQTVRLGTWRDTPLNCTATIGVGKEYLLQTGPDSYEDLEGAPAEFSFELHEGDEDGRLLQTLKVPVTGGAGNAAFKPIEFTFGDVGRHVYTVVEAPADDNRIQAQEASRQVSVEVSVKDGTARELVASIDGGEASRSASGDVAFTNVYTPGFDIMVAKQDKEADGRGEHRPLKGAEFTVFEIAGLGADAQPSIPALFTEAEAFDSVFTPTEDARTLAFDADAATAAGAQPVATIATGADGIATTEGRLLDAGKAYAVVETAAPAGYTLQLPHPTVYLVDDLVPDGSYAHMAYPDASAADGMAIVDKDTAGADVEHVGTQAKNAYRITVGSASGAVADAEMVFENARNGQPMGGLGVRKVDAASGAGLPGAEFWAWDEEAFSKAYRNYRNANPDASDAEFLSLVTGSYSPEYDTVVADDDDESAPATDEEQEEAETGNPYQLEPAAMLDPTDGDGYAATTETELPPGAYRIVEVNPPRSYDPPAYDFTTANGGQSGNISVTVVGGRVSMAETPIANVYHPMEASAPITAIKHLEGGTLYAGQFQFRLYDAQDEAYSHTVLAGSNAADGSIDLGNFWYSTDEGGTARLLGSDGHVYQEAVGSSASKTYAYRLVESIPDGATATIDGETCTFAAYVAEHGRAAAGEVGLWTYGDIAYDATVKTLTVEVEEEDGALVLDASWEGRDATFENTVPHDFTQAGGLLLKKVDQGGLPLEGATFTVSGTRADTRAPYSTTIASDGDGIAQMAPDEIPLGSYTVRESTAPDGFTRDASWERSFVLAEDGQIADFSQEEADWCVNRKSPIPMPVTGLGGTSCLVLISLALLCTSLLLRRRSIPAPGRA